MFYFQSNWLKSKEQTQLKQLLLPFMHAHGGSNTTFGYVKNTGDWWNLSGDYIIQKKSIRPKETIPKCSQFITLDGEWIDFNNQIKPNWDQIVQDYYNNVSSETWLISLIIDDEIEEEPLQYYKMLKEKYWTKYK